jgi:transcriptional regulator with XRE-family HTH domain
MSFAEKLKVLMGELDLSQSKLSDLTGIGKSSISQYLSGKNEPSKDRKKEIARKLGVQEDYFDTFETTATVQHDGVFNLPVTLAAKLMGKSKEWVKQGLRDGVFPWGYAVKLTNWSYFISSVKFTEYTGIKVPLKLESEG